MISSVFNTIKLILAGILVVIVIGLFIGFSHYINKYEECTKDKDRMTKQIEDLNHQMDSFKQSVENRVTLVKVKNDIDKEIEESTDDGEFNILATDKDSTTNACGCYNDGNGWVFGKRD